MIEVVAAAARRPVSRETSARLADYADRLKAANSVQNLVSGRTIESLWERHIVDSAQLVHFEPYDGAAWADVGSGAGLPGIVIACLCSGPVTLIEPRRLRAEFLRTTVVALGLNVRVESVKAERVAGSFDVVTGRAVASLPTFLAMCAHLSTKKTVWVLPKGKSANSELAEARRTWQGEFHVEPSVTDVDSRIIVGTEVRARGR